MSVTFNFSRGFVKDVRQLRKRYRLVEDDIDDLMVEMEREGYRGDLMPDVGHEIYKIRVANQSARRGKRGGFRVLYIPLDADTLLFVHIYSKSDKVGTSLSEVRRILRDLTK